MNLDYFMIVLATLAAAVSLRIILGPTVWDRILGYNILSSKVIILIVLFAARQRQAFLLDTALVYTLLGFASIVLISKFIQGRGKM